MLRTKPQDSAITGNVLPNWEIILPPTVINSVMLAISTNDHSEKAGSCIHPNIGAWNWCQKSSSIALNFIFGVRVSCWTLRLPSYLTELFFCLLIPGIIGSLLQLEHQSLQYEFSILSTEPSYPWLDSYGIHIVCLWSWKGIWANAVVQDMFNISLSSWKNKPQMETQTSKASNLASTNERIWKISLWGNLEFLIQDAFFLIPFIYLQISQFQFF